MAHDTRHQREDCCTLPHSESGREAASMHRLSRSRLPQREDNMRLTSSTPSIIVHNTLIPYVTYCRVLEIMIGFAAPMADWPYFGFSSSSERIKKRVRCRYRLSYFCLSSQRVLLAPLWPLKSPTWTTPPSITCRRAFPFFSPSCKKSLFCGLFCNTYEHVVLEQQTQHSKAQPCTKQQSKYVPNRARQSKPADRVGEN